MEPGPSLEFRVNLFFISAIALAFFVRIGGSETAAWLGGYLFVVFNLYKELLKKTDNRSEQTFWLPKIFNL